MIAMMTPSWFCTKKRTGSDRLAGSRSLAFFQSCEPTMARIAITTSPPRSAQMNQLCEVS